jgi:hypothetical protein
MVVSTSSAPTMVYLVKKLEKLAMKMQDLNTF